MNDSKMEIFGLRLQNMFVGVFPGAFWWTFVGHLKEISVPLEQSHTTSAPNAPMY